MKFSLLLPVLLITTLQCPTGKPQPKETDPSCWSQIQECFIGFVAIVVDNGEEPDEKIKSCAIENLKIIQQNFELQNRKNK